MVCVFDGVDLVGHHVGEALNHLLHGHLLGEVLNHLLHGNLPGCSTLFCLAPD